MRTRIEYGVTTLCVSDWKKAKAVFLHYHQTSYRSNELDTAWSDLTGLIQNYPLRNAPGDSLLERLIENRYPIDVEAIYEIDSLIPLITRGKDTISTMETESGAIDRCYRAVKTGPGNSNSRPIETKGNEKTMEVIFGSKVRSISEQAVHKAMIVLEHYYYDGVVDEKGHILNPKAEKATKEFKYLLAARKEKVACVIDGSVLAEMICRFGRESNFGGRSLESLIPLITRGEACKLAFESETEAINRCYELVTGKKGEEKTMKNDKIESAKTVGHKVKDAYTLGIVISGSQEINEDLVALVRKRLGDRYPTFFSTEVGAMLEPLVIPALTMYACEVVDDFPQKDRVRQVCERAVTGAAKDQGDQLRSLLRPILIDVANLAKDEAK